MRKATQRACIVGLGFICCNTTMNLSVAAENPLSIRVIKVERLRIALPIKVNVASTLLMSVENKSDQRVDTIWSCVFFAKGEPVHEQETLVENVPPHGRAISSDVAMFYPFDNVECRFIRATTITPSFGGDDPLSIRLIKTERLGDSTDILMSVENKSDKEFKFTHWSCVFFDKGEPVHEGQTPIEKVPPHGRVFKSHSERYGGPFDKIDVVS
jgi:hypothetical protein